MDGDISEIGKRILDVQTISTRDTQKQVEPCIKYMEAGQEYLRSLVGKFRKQLNLTVALKAVTRATEEASAERGGYGYSYAIKSLTRSMT